MILAFCGTCTTTIGGDADRETRIGSDRATTTAEVAAMTRDVASGPQLSAAEKIVRAMKPGEWRELPDTRMQDVFPKIEGHPDWGVVGPPAVTAAWGGAAFDIKRNVLVVTGGGHADYGGNEVYEFFLSTMRWVRATEPSPLRPTDGQGHFEVADGSGAPVSSHTYDGLQYLPNVDRVFKFGGSYYRLGWADDTHAYLYDLETKTWQRRAKAPYQSLVVSTAYDPRSGEALVAFNTGLMAYDPLRDRWRVLIEGDSDGPGSVADFDPINRRFVQLGSEVAPVVYYSIGSPSRRITAPTVGDISFKQLPVPGLAYHPPTRRFVVWQGGREVWTIDAGSWELTLYRNPGGAAPNDSDLLDGHKTRGIYGRWQYIPTLDVFIGYGHSTDNVWLYKLPPRSKRAARKG
jgi:hypothetical protein